MKKIIALLLTCLLAVVPDFLAFFIPNQLTFWLNSGILFMQTFARNRTLSKAPVSPIKALPFQAQHAPVLNAIGLAYQ